MFCLLGSPLSHHAPEGHRQPETGPSGHRTTARKEVNSVGGKGCHRSDNWYALTFCIDDVRELTRTYMLAKTRPAAKRARSDKHATTIHDSGSEAGDDDGDKQGRDGENNKDGSDGDDGDDDEQDGDEDKVVVAGEDSETELSESGPWCCETRIKHQRCRPSTEQMGLTGVRPLRRPAGHRV